MDDIDIEISDKFEPKRLYSEMLSMSYSRLGYASKADRVNNCGTYLEFVRSVNSDDPWRLHTANFCRDRLCPMCSWRRSYKIFGQVSKIMDNIVNDYVFLFLTLTVPNCSGIDLCCLIDDMYAGFRKLIHYKRFDKSVCGFFRSLEVTYNNKRRSSSYGTFHPHFHCILAVNKSYFKSNDYIKRDEWLYMWQKAMNDPRITQVDIRKCKPKEQITEGEEAVKALSSAVAEVAKYAVKSADYLFVGDEKKTDDTVMWLSAALHGRRLCSFGGVFDDIRKKFGLSDCENGDLVHIDDEVIRSDVAYMIRRYGWSCGAYRLLEYFISYDVNIEVGEDEKN